MIKNIKCVLDLFLPVETCGPEFTRNRQRLAQAERVACSLSQQVFFARILQPSISLRLPVLYNHQVTLYTPVLCTDLVMCKSSVRTSNVALQKPTF